MSQPYTMMKDGHILITLEELCRSMWRQDKKGFLESAKNNSYRLFVSQFEREDAAEAASRDGRRFRARR
jgi:hypothetical protein